MATYSKKQVKYGIIISYIVLVLSIIIHLVTTPLYLKYLGDNLFGIKSFCNSLVSYITLVTLGMSSSYIRFYTKMEKEEGVEGVKRVNSIYLLFYIIASFLGFFVFCVIVLLLSHRIIDLTKYNDEQINIIIIIVVIQSVSTIVSFLLSIFELNITANERFIFKNSVNCMITILNPILTIVFLYFGYSVIATVIISSICTFIQLILNMLYSIFFVKIRFKMLTKSDFTLFKEILVFSTYIFIIQIVSELNNESDKIILGILVGSEAVTLYQIGVQFRTYLNSLAITISNSYSPYINKCVLENDKIAINNVFNKVSELQMIVLFFIVGGFVSCGLPFTIAWLGPGYELTYYIATFVLVIQTVSYSQLAAVEIQRALNKHKFRAILYLIVAIINVIISIILCYGIGIMGCVIGTVISYTVQLVIMNFYNGYVIGLNLKYYWKRYVYYFISSIIPISLCLVLVYSHVLENVNVFFKWNETFIIGLLFVFMFFIIQVIFNRKKLIELCLTLKRK